MASWNSRPYELRLMIWELVALESVEERRALKLRPDASRLPSSLAACAAASREWQNFFERVTFRRLVVYDHEVDQFAAVVQGIGKARLGYIRHLHFHVRLCEYGIVASREPEDDKIRHRNNAIFTNALWPLLEALATWDGRLRQSAGDRAGKEGGLVLELSAASRSDSKHWFKDFQFQPDYPYESVDDLESDFAAYKKWMVSPGGVRTRQRPPLLLSFFLGNSQAGCCNRVLGLSPSGDALLGVPAKNTKYGVPKLNVVRGLLIRRRFYRVIGYQLISALLSSGLRNIRELHIEQWDKRNLLEMIGATAEKRLPPSLRKLHLFRSLHQLYDPPHIPTPYEVTENTLVALVRATRPLQSVALTGIVDASVFFRTAESECQSPSKGRSCLWPRLTTIALSGAGLGPALREASMILEKAGYMALEMPKLKIMELWNPLGKCLFRFEASSEPKIIMKAPWDMRCAWTAECHQAWAAVAAKHSDRPLQISFERLPRCDLWCYNVLRHLKLRNEILDPVSRYQIECQNLRYDPYYANHESQHQWAL